MSSSFERVARIRRLLEDVGRAELAAWTTQRRQCELAIENQEAQGQASDRQAHEAIRRDADSPVRVRVIDDGDRARQRAARMRGGLAEVLRAEENARENYLLLRRETRQVERLVADERSRTERERVKREQAQIDDWFGARLNRS